MFKGNVATAGINFSMSTCWNQHPGVFSLTDMPSVRFAMATLYLSKRDQRRERKLRASTVLSEVSEEYVLEDEADADVKKAKRQGSEAVSMEVTEVPVPTLISEAR